MAISVEQLSATRFKVTVPGPPATAHTVTVAEDYWKRLTGGRTDMETLVEKSFEFLLARESNTSILRSFDLPVIQQYFPDYERTIAEMLGSSRAALK